MQHFSSVFRPKNRKILIFRPKFKVLKMMSKCIKWPPKHFFWTSETPQTHFHTLGVLQGPILVAGCRFKVTWLRWHFRPKSRFFGENQFLREIVAFSCRTHKGPIRSMYDELQSHKVCKTHLNLLQFSKIKILNNLYPFFGLILRLKSATGLMPFKRFLAEKSENFDFSTKIQTAQNDV